MSPTTGRARQRHGGKVAVRPSAVDDVVADMRSGLAAVRCEEPGLLDQSLADELAAVANRCISGYSDDRPVDGQLVLSRLGAVFPRHPPRLCTARVAGELVGWAAVRHRDIDEDAARLWGPLVLPEYQALGYGSYLLQAATAAVAGPLASTDVPSDRSGAGAFFLGHGWLPGAELGLYRSRAASTDAGRLAVTTAADLPPERAQRLVALAARRARGLDVEAADRVWPRWKNDHRFRPELLLLDENEPGLCLLLAQFSPSGSELLVAELWSDSPEVRAKFARSAVELAAQVGVSCCRALMPVEKADALVSAGFELAATSVQYRLPAQTCAVESA